MSRVTPEFLAPLLAKLSAAYQKPVSPVMAAVYLEGLADMYPPALAVNVDGWIRNQPTFPKVSELLDFGSGDLYAEHEALAEHRQLKAAEFPTTASDEFSKAAIALCRRFKPGNYRQVLEAELEQPSLPDDPEWCGMILRLYNAP